MAVASIANMNNFGRMAACWVIAEYIDAEKRAALNMIDIIYKRIKIHGFVVPYHCNLHSDFLATTIDYIFSGNIRARAVSVEKGSAYESDFELKVASLGRSAEPGSDEIILRNLFVSIDPAQINRMKSYSSSQKSVKTESGIIPGQQKVLVSHHPEFVKDDLVVAFIHWGDYSVQKVEMLRKLEPTIEFPLSYHLGVLGFNGLTAYVGLFEICKPRKGERVFVSAACGSVGIWWVALLKEKLGFDDAFNYKEETDLKSTLQRYFPDGINTYFDNVGAEMLEAAIANMNKLGRVASSMRGTDHSNLHSDFITTTIDYIRSGKIKVLEDISVGLETIPSAFTGLFHGHNVGKKIVKVADE
ncbi:hypothetical protein H0E87_013228 [Populus deltoides]|uniref:Oxidoreductase N-terminal domain-containing protein n=1 Tax=Populus deltoides TaxID=3696 RepID=A0A8T2YMP0_POPDE|nr:hypothetical protein H0E87_013228 [Populus deltoides]